MARPRKENADYFSHDTNLRSHRKIIALRNKFGLEGYAVYNMMLEHIASCDYFVSKWDDLEREIISGDFGVSVEKIQEIIGFCGRLELFEMDGNTIKCKSLTDRLSELIEKRNRERNRVSVAETTQAVAESPQSKVKESKENYIQELEVYSDKRNKTEKFGAANKSFIKCKKITDNIKKSWNTCRKDFTVEEIYEATKNYKNYVKSLKPDERDYYKHRFSLSEFIKQENGLKKFFNY